MNGYGPSSGACEQRMSAARGLWGCRCDRVDKGIRHAVLMGSYLRVRARRPTVTEGVGCDAKGYSDGGADGGGARQSDGSGGGFFGFGVQQSHTAIAAARAQVLPTARRPCSSGEPWPPGIPGCYERGPQISDRE